MAREAFGYAELRPGQREAIESALAGHDALVVMSTGSGKSAIYQIAGLLTPGATVVVSREGGLDRLALPGSQLAIAECLVRHSIDPGFVGQAP